MTKKEVSWVLYDVGNSAFIMMVSTIIPIYFKSIAKANGVDDSMSTAYWAYASSIATIVVAILGPTLGAIGDHRGFKKKLFFLFCLIGTISCAVMGFFSTWLLFLMFFIIAKIGFSASIIFYDAMLCDVTTDERMDMVSTKGYAYGYIGSCIPFVCCLVLVLMADRIGIKTEVATIISFIITSIWWFCFSMPLLKSHEQIHFVENSKNIVSESFKRLAESFTDISKNKSIFTFLLAFFLYIDGVYTIIEMATVYGSDVGITSNDMLLALLLTQIIAFPFALLFGRLSSKMKTPKLIIICIIGYFFATVFALQLDKAWEFWFLAIFIAIFQGGIQALSRSYFAKIIPQEKSNQYFGIFDIFGKGAAFVGTLLMGLATQITGNSKSGVACIALLFVAGFFIFNRHLKEQS